MNFNHLFEILKNGKDNFPEKSALNYKRKDTYHSISYKQLFKKVSKFAQYLNNLGVKKGDCVAILSNNSPKWVISDFAIMGLGAVTVPIYSTLMPNEIAYILNDSKAEVVIAQTQIHVNRILEVIDQLPHLKHIICIKKKMVSEKISIHYFNDCINETTVKDTIFDSINKTKNEDLLNSLATIVYTSGTTGAPKGVMLSHKNIITNIESILEVIEIKFEDSILSFLPLSHVFERTVGYYLMLAKGVSIFYAESIDTVGSDISLVKPTLLIGVPRFYEKLQTKIYDNLKGLKKILFYAALNTARSFYSYKKKFKIPLKTKLLYKLYDRIVFSKIRKKTGGNLRLLVSGGAPLGKDLCLFFKYMGLPIIEGYGLTETSPVISFNRPKYSKEGTVGQVLPRVEVKLDIDGELLVKADSVMQGYLNQPKATKEAIEDGWFHTGDIAEIDKKGFIKIVDRKKELIVLSNGKKVPPQLIEQHLSSDRFISQIIVIGEGRNYLTALIVPNKNKLEEKARSENWRFNTYEGLLNEKVVKNFYKLRLNKLQETFANYERVKTFLLLPSEFTQETGELTPSLKIKRKIIYKKFENEISSLYKG